MDSDLRCLDSNPDSDLRCPDSHITDGHTHNAKTIKPSAIVGCNNNDGANKRFQLTKQSTVFETSGQIYCNLFGQGRFIPPRTELILKFQRSTGFV